MLDVERHISGVGFRRCRWLREKDVNHNWRSFIVRHIILLPSSRRWHVKPVVFSVECMFVVWRTTSKRRGEKKKTKTIPSLNLEKEIDWIQRIWFDSVLIAFLFLFPVHIYTYTEINLDFLFSSSEKIGWEDRETNDIKEFRRANERTSDRARTITFVDKEGGERERERESEREHDFCCPHNYIKEYKKLPSSVVVARYAWYYCLC
jgi:hypothetical protein